MRLRTLPNQCECVLQGRGQVELGHFQLHAAGLDLRQIEYVVDGGEQVLAGSIDVVDVLRLLGVQFAEIALGQRFGESDDGIERVSQFVRHVREELGFVLVRDFQLPALLLEFIEQAHVLAGDRCLLFECFSQLSGAFVDFAFQLGVRGLELCRHGIELFGERFELIAGADLDALIELARADLLGTPLQRAYRCDHAARQIDAYQDRDNEASE
jgi:hypothetical protein